MQAIYDFFTDLHAEMICWAIIELIAATPVVADGTWFTPVRDGLLFIALFFDTSVFPVHFTIALSAFLGSFVAVWLVRVVRLVWQLIPFV